MRPPFLCRLKKGLILDADDNRGFVDTFNWLVDFIDNLRGDGDIAPGRAIRLDRTIDDRPVIRSDGGGGVGGSAWPCVFEPRFTDGAITGFDNRYFQVGGFTRTCDDHVPSGIGTTIVALSISTTSSSQSGSIVEYASIAALQAAQASLGTTIVPLFQLVDGIVDLDFRRMPTSGMFEYFPGGV
jgi:hypothetical protein